MNKVVRAIVIILIALAVIVPMVPLFEWAFAESWKYPSITPVFTVEYISYYLQSNMMLEPLKNSIILSLLVTGLSLIIGFYPAKYLGTKKFKGKLGIQIFLMVPALVPGIAIVFGMMDIFIKMGIYSTYLALLIGQVTITLPYTIMMLTSVFKNYDEDYEDQSSTLGVGKIDTLLNVTFPMMKSGIAVACMYAFTVSWSIYMFTSMYSPRGFKTMATLLFPLISSTTSATQVTAVATILFFAPSLLFLLFSALVVGSDKINAKGGGQV